MNEDVVVSIVMGSNSDLEVMTEASEVLRKFEIAHEVRVISTHRTPQKAHDFCVGAKACGVKVIIAGAEKAAHLAIVLASLTTLPVIGVPMKTSDLGDLDSLLCTVQRPGGIPVATTAIGKAGAKNAGLLAVGMLALSNGDLSAKFDAYREEMAKAVDQADREVING
jgi:5-(carboxyamino)imidazole ribonucleotide mutase